MNPLSLSAETVQQQHKAVSQPASVCGRVLLHHLVELHFVILKRQDMDYYQFPS